MVTQNDRALILLWSGVGVIIFLENSFIYQVEYVLALAFNSIGINLRV